MSETSPMLSQISTVWNENTILEKGMTFLSQKKEELKLYEDLWVAAQGTDYYGSASKLAAEKVKVCAEKSSKEIKTLNNAVTELLNAESTKDPFSDKTKQLSRIALASRRGMNYFETIAEEPSFYPTDLNKTLNIIGENVLVEFASWATMLRVAAYFLDYTPPIYALTAWKISLVAAIGFNSFLYLNKWASKHKVEGIKQLFEKTLSLDQV